MSGTSPKPKKEFDFYAAIKEIVNGKKVSKAEWGNKKVYCLLEAGVLKIRKDDGKVYQWIVSEGDIIGKDWFIVSA